MQALRRQRWSGAASAIRLVGPWVATTEFGSWSAIVTNAVRKITGIPARVTARAAPAIRLVGPKIAIIVFGTWSAVVTTAVRSTVAAAVVAG